MRCTLHDRLQVALVLLGFFSFAAQAEAKTKFLDISVVISRDSQWSSEEIKRLLDNAERAFGECEIKVRQIEMLKNDVPELEAYSIIDQRYYLDSVKGAKPSHRPAVFLTEKQGPAVGVAIRKALLEFIHGYPDNREMLNTIWMKHALWKLAGGHYHVLSHEIGHLLELEHTEDRAGMMYGDPIPLNGPTPQSFTPKECGKMRRSPLLK